MYVEAWPDGKAVSWRGKGRVHQAGVLEGIEFAGVPVTPHVRAVHIEHDIDDLLAFVIPTLVNSCREWPRQ